MISNKPRSQNSGWTKVWSISLTGVLALSMFFILAMAMAMAADSQEHTTLGQTEHSGSLSADAYREGNSAADQLAAERQSQPADSAAPTDAALTVEIVSSPWALLDHNNPSGAGEEVPKVFVVEAVVTNNGPDPAQQLTVLLDYDKPGSNWMLLPGEDPERTIDELPSGEAYHAYWFARYSTGIGATHQYTVTAYADNAATVSTSENSGGGLDPGVTVMTKGFLSTGNSGISQVSADVVVGVAFTVTVRYDLGTKPAETIFSPAGNLDFDPGAYRLLAAKVRFFNDAEDQQITYDDRLFFNTLPDFAENAEATYTFIALTPADTQLCAYTGVGYQSTDKYDQGYCSEEDGTVIHIGGSISLVLDKQMSSSTIQQNQTMTYTIAYTNDGDLPLTYAWIWDDVNASLASIITTSITGDYDPDETTEGRVAWYLGNIDPGEGDEVSFAVRVDGAGQDIADGTSLVNQAFFGINQGTLPTNPALTSTVTTTIQAPTISVSKTDGQLAAEPGDALNYTLHITNSGSVAATGLVLTDILPTDVVYVPGTATPPETIPSGQTPVWSLPDIAPDGGTAVINIPVTLGSKTPNGTVLNNQMTVKYENAAGWVFATEMVTDSTLVNAPVLDISKSDFPDPVLTGHVITYTLHYTNSGPAAATNVLITDVVPLNTTYQTCSAAPCGMSNGVISWTIDTVPANSDSAVSFSVLVTDTLATGDQIRNEAYGLVADQTDLTTGPPVITTVSREAAFIEGYTFVDTDGDGEYDIGSESTLPGIDITLLKATVPVTTTNAVGYYRFRVETQESISVTADLPAGYFRTTPGTIVLDSFLGFTRTVNFGFAPAASAFGVIYGTVFDDTDHNGVQAVGEDGLQGVTVSSVQAATSPVTTNELGQYTLRFNSSGSVTITETDPTFYVSTTPNAVVANAVTGSSGPSPIDFGDFLGIRITGQVFEDVNVNGLNDDGVNVSGATVAADGDNFMTGSSGVYTLYTTIKDSNPILISETDPAGYVSTDAVPGDSMSRVDANTLRIATPVSGTVYSDGDFGDVQASGVITISGQVWNDNGAGGGGLANGLRDGTEPSLAGAVISVSTGLTQTTTSDGLFLLYAPPNQEVTVSETNPSGYVSTNAIPGDVASKLDNDTLIVGPMSAGATSADNLFGDVLDSSVAAISGSVFDDANENGVFDSGELGLPGVIITLEFNDGRTIVVTTNPTGGYQFAVAPGTEVRLTSARPSPGFYPTTPESIIVRPPTSGIFPSNDFGYSDDTDTSTIFGIVFDDMNSNGQQDFGEPGLAGAVVTLNGAAPITTTGNGLIAGSFTFSVTQADVYTIREKNPPDYRSTTPDEFNIDVTLGKGYPVAFGDTLDIDMASIYGVVFDDLDGNGKQDDDEPGLAGVVISVTVSDGVLTETTGTYGLYSYGFDIPEAGFHTVTEQDPALPGYRSTTPDQVIVKVVLGSSYIINFGDTTADTFSTIMGTVFNDVSGDGVQNPSESGIANVTISLSNGQATTTGANGGYTFAVTEIGPVQVTETDPPNYHSTTPNTVNVNITALGQVYTRNFGDSDNAYAASFFGTVFDDQNSNGAWDLAEPPLSGITVNLSGSATPFATNNWGQFTFLIEDLGTYTVTETDLPGYVSTIAIAGDPAVTVVDHNTLRAWVQLGRDLGDNLFGDVLASEVITISGHVWNDNGAGGGGAGDGIWDPDEPPLAGATVSLSSGTYQTTGADGAFRLHALPGQQITVTEANPLGYVSTGAIPGNDATKVDDDTLIVADTLSAGEASTNNRFGDKLCTCEADMYEPDNSPAQATALEIGVANTQAHDFCDDTIDWVKFTAQAYNVYTITTSSWGQRADTILALFDTDGQTLLAANDDYEDATDFSSRIVWQPSNDGVYFVRISNRAMLYGCDCDYDVWIEREVVYKIFLPLVMRSSVATAVTEVEGFASPTGIINHSCEDDYEIDDRWQQAHNIDAGVVQIHSFDSNPVAFAADKDFVWFNVKAERTVTFTVVPVANTQTLLELYDDQGDTLDVAGTTQLVWTPSKGGRYYLSVSPLTDGFGCADVAGYSLLMEEPRIFDLYLPLMVK